MDTLLHNLAENPLLYVGIPLSVYAVIGFLTFLRGFIGGVGHLVTNSGHNEHQEEARVRATWGFCIALAAFLAWESARFVASWFGYTTMHPIFGFSVVTLLVLWIVYTAVTSTKGGH